MPQPHRILIVDDDPFARGALRKQLAKIGARAIAEAGDGAEALGHLRETGAELVILDIKMAPMNGLQVLKRVRTGEAGVPRDLRIVALTSATDERIFGTALALDCNAFLVKPVEVKRLAGTANSVLREPFKPKPKAAYDVIQVPGVVPQTTPAPSGGASIADLDDLVPGQVLASDVRTGNGNLLLAAGTVLTRSHIARLNELGRIGGLMLVAVQAENAA